ncbi:MAG TPA: hypothetical protein DIW24_02115 [Bacteroidetes bacterium]|nr:hypothetical protein [Bacteroidota bacterium]HRR10321.1 glycerophosphodiester phosphodiesterase family protein [Rhodothermales bacterium]
MQKTLILAHRGLVTEYQENSLPAIKAAAESPYCDGTEFDVFLTKDQKVVLFHDENPKRLTGVDGNIYDMTWPELQKIALMDEIEVDGGLRKYAKTEKICLLTDVLEELRGKDVFLDIELKAYNVSWGKRKIGREVARIVRQFGMEEQCVLTSFNFFMTFDAEWAYPHIHTAFAYDDNIPLPGKWLNRILESNFLGKLVRSSMVIAEHTLLDDDTIAQFAARHMRTGTFTLFPLMPKELPVSLVAEHTDILRRLAKQGVGWVETDHPELAHRVLHG